MTASLNIDGRTDTTLLGKQASAFPNLLLNTGGFFAESAVDNITALAGGGYNGATPIANELTRVVTVATAGDSIVLPQSTSGLGLFVINHSANPCQVFGGGTDTIDDVVNVITSPVIAGAAGTFTCAATQLPLQVGNVVNISGTNSGGGTVANGSYLISVTNGSTSFTLTTLAGAAITTVAGTPTGLTFNNYTGVSQMGNSTVLYFSATAGNWYTEGLAGGFVRGYALQTFSSGTYAANATGTQASGTLITSMLCNLTAAGANYSVTLPPSSNGMDITVHNISSQTVKVYPSAGGTGTETINALSANTAISLAANTSCQFTCVVAGQWYTVPRVPS